MTLADFGFADLTGYVASLRYALVVLALLWAAAVARAPRFVALVMGLIFAFVATGFWIVGLRRPYGLLEDAAVTRRAAEVAVAAATGRSDESFVAGEPLGHRGFVALLKAGLSVDTLAALPSVMPAVAVAGIGLLVFGLWARRDEALIGACLWLALATGDLDAARGLGFVPGTWRYPEQAIVVVSVAVLALVVARLPRPSGIVAAGLVSLWCLALPASASAPNVADALLMLTLDQGLWLLLAAVGLLRATDAASLGLCIGGAVSVMIGAALGRGGCSAGLALFRLGVLLASALALPPLLRAAGEAVRRAAPRLQDIADERVGLALLLALSVPGSFLAWWDPVRVDPVARLSQEPISPALAPVMRFIRESTPRDAVFVASSDYAPALAVFGARRVLRAPSVLVTADDGRRLRAEGAILAGRPIPPGGDGYGARFVLLAPGDFKARGITGPEDLAGRPGFRMLYADAAGYRVYEVVR